MVIGKGIVPMDVLKRPIFVKTKKENKKTALHNLHFCFSNNFYYATAGFSFKSFVSSDLSKSISLLSLTWLIAEPMRL